MFSGRFLPERLRPRTRRRQSRPGVLAPATLGVLVLVLLPLWSVHSVEVTGAEVVPPQVLTSLEALSGHSMLLLDLDWVRMVAATWPAAGEVRVRLELPGTIVMEVFPETARGSVRIGAGWHAVASDGRIAGALSAPVAPQLKGFRRPAERRLAFVVARRLADASGGAVEQIRLVTPEDFRLDLRFEGLADPVVLHVVPGGTEAERSWCRAAAKHGPNCGWADLRWPRRMVVRGLARDPVAAEVGS